MTRKELLYTVTIYDEGSFSAAAKKLFVSQPALSQTIRKLEDEFGFVLFIRVGAKSEPTKACRLFVEQGRPLLHAWEQFESEMHIYAGIQQSELTIGMPPYFLKNLVPYVLPRYRELHPNVKIEVIEDKSDTVEKLAMQGLINLGVVTEPVHFDSIGRTPVITAEFLLAVPIDHPFCRKHPYRGLDELETVDLRELRDEPFALLKNPRNNHIWEQMFAELGFVPKIYRRSSVWNNIHDYVKHGACIALLHEFLVSYEPDDSKIAYYRINFPHLRPDTVATYYPGKRLSIQEQWFIDILKEYKTVAKRQRPEPAQIQNRRRIP